ncbi:Hypothetical predicted protein [Mytilus galloprovincialis]|uniref:DZIP3-like HEPN domain-containing protein n=1 Tax=Mytilus galloprovincialis TaxID=29158 RepID=A0A8B6FD50_MYTGA|nr:Hypothetical predicted protein [Mytilus galloprovincialis]
MDREDQRRYLVVGSVILEVVTPLFQQKIENDFTTGGFGSLQTFINSQSVIHTLFHLRHRNSWCCKDKPNCHNLSALPLVYCQWNKLFSEKPGPGIHNCHCKFSANPVQLNELDITLSSLILLNCCNLSQPEEEAVQLLRQYKNDYLSHNTTGCITQTEYNTLWPDLVTYILRLDPTKQDDLVRIEHRPLDESLCKKYFTCLLDLYQQFEEIMSTMQTVHSSIQVVSSSIGELNSSVKTAFQEMDTTVHRTDIAVQGMDTTVQEMGKSFQGIKTSVQQTNDLLKELLHKGLTCECGRQIIIPICNDERRKHRKQYQLGQNIFYFHQQLNLQLLFNNDKEIWISDVKMMDDGRLVFCLPFERRILICKTDGSQRDSIYVHRRSCNVTAVNNSVVAVTVPSLTEGDLIDRIEMFDLNTKHKLKSISVTGMVSFYGITILNNKFVVGGVGKLLIVDHETGETIQTIETGCRLNNLHASGDKIFFTDVFSGNLNKTLNWYNYIDKTLYTKTLSSSSTSITSLQDGSLMEREDKRRYLVVGSVILEVVTPLVQQKIETDYKTGGFGSLQKFINSQDVIHTLFHIRHGIALCCNDQKNCRNPAAFAPLYTYQWNKLYSRNQGLCNKNCHCKYTANSLQLTDLDISLSSVIFISCCTLSQNEKEAVQMLREYKNKYLSHNTTGCISQTEYNTLWPNLVLYVSRLDSDKVKDVLSIENRPLDEYLSNKYHTCLLDLHEQV